MKTATAKVNPDYTLTRPKRLRKFEKDEKGMKVVAKTWQEPEKIKKPITSKATTVKGKRIELRREMQRKAAQ